MRVRGGRDHALCSSDARGNQLGIRHARLSHLPRDTTQDASVQMLDTSRDTSVQTLDTSGDQTEQTLDTI